MLNKILKGLIYILLFFLFLLIIYFSFVIKTFNYSGEKGDYTIDVIKSPVVYFVPFTGNDGYVILKKYGIPVGYDDILIGGGWGDIDNVEWEWSDNCVLYSKGHIVCDNLDFNIDMEIHFLVNIFKSEQKNYIECIACDNIIK